MSLFNEHQSLKRFINDNSFTDPFTSISYRWMPSSMNELFDLCEWLYRNNGIYGAAIRRIARLFVTDFRYETSEENYNLEELKDFIEKKRYFTKSLMNIGIDYLAYGNSFITLYLPFKRWLKNPATGETYLASKVQDLNYVGDGKFEGIPPGASRSIKMEYRDVPDKDLNKIKIIRIPPKEIEIIHNPFNGGNTYFWKMSNKTKKKFENGKGTILMSETPVEYLEAIKHDKKIEFNSSNLLHTAYPTLAGTNVEYGMPFALSCFPLIFYIAVLRKANEAISMDYIVPMRIMFPQNNTSYQEASYMVGDDFSSNMRRIVQHHRADPADYHISPVPVGYQTIGGEKRSLMISDDIKLSNDELLNSIGFPAELFYGTLSLQATPMALRLLENTFGLTGIYNEIIDWVLDRALAFMSVNDIKVELVPFKWHDDIERRQMMVQLAASQKISDIDILEMYGLDYEETQNKKMEQMNILQKVEQDNKQRMQQQQQMQQQQGQGMGDGVNTPSDINQTAQALAQELVYMPEGPRRMKLDDLNKTQPLLHAAVKKEMERVRNKMGTEGRHMMMQQQMQQSGMM